MSCGRIMRFSFFFWAILSVQLSTSFSDTSNDVSNDGALYLTPYIEKGMIKEAQILAKITPMLPNVKSFSGFLTVNKTTNSNLFFWLFKCHENWEERPLVVWLGGDCVVTKIRGVLRDVGPFSFDRKRVLRHRKYAWTRKYNLLFIDKIVGAGFSFTEFDSGYSATVFDAAIGLHDALTQIYTLFPVLKHKKLIISGESYGTKFALALTHRIVKLKQTSTFNLEKLILLSSFMNPAESVNFGPVLFNLGLIDDRKKQYFTDLNEQFRAFLRSSDYISAQAIFTLLLSELKQSTGLRSYLNFVNDDVGKASNLALEWFITQPEVKKNLHVGSRNTSDGKMASATMMSDYTKSVKPLVEDLLTAEFPVLFVNGQLDVLSAYALDVDWLKSLQLPRVVEYTEAKRCQFRVGDDVAGYFKTAGSFTEVLPRNTGHIITAGNPKWAFELVDKYISNATSFLCI